MKEFLENIATYNDFPVKGVVFKDLLGLLLNPEIFNKLIIEMSSSQSIKKCDAILAIEARGFLFGSAISLLSKKPLVVARKPEKLPGELILKSYDLEYGSNTLTIQKKSLKDFQSFTIVDDVLATGGTLKCACDLLKGENKSVIGVSVVMEIKKLEGRKKIKYPVKSQIII